MPELTGDEPDLRLGDSGEGVVLLQVRLYRLGFYRTVPDGTYDGHTENAVRDLQSSVGQDNDGMVSRATWEAILYSERQAGIQYTYQRPYDALDQIIYDLQNPHRASGDFAAVQGPLSQDGQWQWDGYAWQRVQHWDQQVSNFVGRLSDDGQWLWDGYGWQAVATSHDGQVGQLSDDGYWRWDGYSWQPAWS